MLTALFPGLEVVGGTAPPTRLASLAATSLNLLLYAVLAYLLAGPAALAAAGVAEPAWAAGLRDNKAALFGGYILVNAISSKLGATGAYEVTLDGALVWSKLATGGVPPLEALVQAIAKGTGLAPDPRVAAQLGLQLGSLGAA